MKSENKLIVCNKVPHKKRYLVSESKKKPGYGICPACGNYHRLEKED